MYILGICTPPPLGKDLNKDGYDPVVQVYGIVHNLLGYALKCCFGYISNCHVTYLCLVTRCNLCSARGKAREIFFPNYLVPIDRFAFCHEKLNPFCVPMYVLPIVPADLAPGKKASDRYTHSGQLFFLD